MDLSNDDQVLMAMGIEKTSIDDGTIRITTPGAIVTLGENGVLRARQRIGTERELISCNLPEHLSPWRLAQETPFRCLLEGNGLRVTVQGDSVLIFCPQQHIRLTFEGHFEPEYAEEVRGNRLFLDPMGGCGFYGIPVRPTDLDKGDDRPWRLGCHLARWDELWVSICPPRAEDPKRLYQSIAHEGEYPPTDVVREIAEHCQILTMHTGIWKDAPDWAENPPGAGYTHPKPWATDRHIPADAGEFVRVRDQAHDLGMAVIPYCSPYYCNAPDLYAERERVLEEYQVDGLYFDGWAGHRDDFRPAYHMIRRARSILGDRILYLHSSSEPFRSVEGYCPFVFAYADFCLRGEAGRGNQELDPFLRYTVSGHQISNAVGMWCHYGSMGLPGYHDVVPSTEHIEAALRHHVRIWRQSLSWSKFPGQLARFDQEYYGGLARFRKEV